MMTVTERDMEYTNAVSLLVKELVKELPFWFTETQDREKIRQLINRIESNLLKLRYENDRLLEMQL